MKIRELNSNSFSFNGIKEFNHLRIKNLDEFLLKYTCNLDIYKSPFSILADLEQQIKFENNPENTILCAYKDEGDVIFDLVEIKIENNIRIVEYEFATFIF